MNSTLLVLQIVGVVVAVVVSLFFANESYGSSLRWRWRRLLPARDREKGFEGLAPGLPWYRAARVETGIMEVSLAMDAAAMALPAFTQPGRGVPFPIIVSFQAALLLSCVISTVATLWLYGIYVWQLGGSLEELGGAPLKPGSGGSLFSARKSGPYALLIYAMILLLIGLGLLPLITAL